MMKFEYIFNTYLMIKYTKTLKEQTSGVVVVPSTALENEIISNKEIDNLIAEIKNVINKPGR